MPRLVAPGCRMSRFSLLLPDTFRLLLFAAVNTVFERLNVSLLIGVRAFAKLAHFERVVAILAVILITTYAFFNRFHDCHCRYYLLFALLVLARNPASGRSLVYIGEYVNIPLGI
jgi:hypothetical protein